MDQQVLYKENNETPPIGGQVSGLGVGAHEAYRQASPGMKAIVAGTEGFAEEIRLRGGRLTHAPPGVKKIKIPVFDDFWKLHFKNDTLSILDHISGETLTITDPKKISIIKEQLQALFVETSNAYCQARDCALEEGKALYIAHNQGLEAAGVCHARHNMLVVLGKKGGIVAVRRRAVRI